MFAYIKLSHRHCYKKPLLSGKLANMSRISEDPIWQSFLKLISHLVNCLSAFARNLGLTISLKKAEVMYQTTPGKKYGKPSIIIGRNKLPVVHKFTHLRSVLPAHVCTDGYFIFYIQKGSVSFASFMKQI